MRDRQSFRSQFLQGADQRFEPRSDLLGKKNFGVHVFFSPDGSMSKAVRLNVLNDRHREEIIGFHFAQQYAEIHYGEQLEQPQFYIVGRDNPWDMEYVMHDGTTFYLEICRVADKGLLKAMKIENDVMSLLHKPVLLGFEIEKIEKHFPGTLPEDMVEKVKTKANRKQSFSWDNSNKIPNFFLRPPISPRLNLRDEIENSLRKKSEKKHGGKERTIIVLDNLTTHSQPEDFFGAVSELTDFVDQLPFKSIWLYTGYYSDDDGYNCEYSLVPIKLSDEEIRYLSRHIPR